MIHLKNASKKLRKDVWIMNGYTDRLDEVSLQSIYKSSTDDFLQCQSVDLTDFDLSAESLKKLSQKSSKIRAQEIEVNFPCLVYNIGLSQLKI